MPKFILIVREDLERIASLSEEKLKAIIYLHNEWAEKLTERGLFVQGHGIGPEGLTVFFKDYDVKINKLVEHKMGIGGFYIIEAASLEAAADVARECPTFHLGDVIEVRPII